MILTEEYLRNSKHLYHTNINVRKEQILRENRLMFAQTKNYDLFISHSSLDNSLVYNLIELFNNAGYSVYVDYIEDPQLNMANVNDITAKTLRERMKNCLGLAYISTTNIVTSRWCPWELGYMDGRKNGRCAILPILKTSSSSFKGQEYLSLYPYIDYEKREDNNKYDFWVNDPRTNNKYISLKKWINGSELIVHPD